MHATCKYYQNIPSAFLKVTKICTKKDLIFTLEGL